MATEDNIIEDTQSVTPDTEETVTPDTEETVTPDTEETVTPDTEETVTSDTEEPVTSDTEEPVTSDTEELVITEDDGILIDELLDNLPKEEEIPTEPKFFPKEEENKEEFIDEELLNDLDAGFTELETELSETKETLSERETAFKELEEQSTSYSEALDKLGEHPILGPLNEKLLKGEEVNIPDYLEKSLQEDIDALPNMEEVPHEKTGQQEELTLQQKLEQQAKYRY